MAVNKVEANGETLIDLTNDSVTPPTLAEGVTAHDASGKLIVGTMSLNSVTDITDKTFVWNDAPDLSTAVTYNANFTVDGTEYATVRIAQAYNGQRYYYTIGYSGLLVYSELSGWVDDKYKTLKFTGGTDATNTDFISLLNSNGKFKEEQIDLSNLATVDKIEVLTLNEGAFINTSGDECGLSWEQTFGIYDEDDNCLKNGTVIQVVPIVAGSGIEFEKDEENQVIKINAKGGGSASDDSTIGTWVFKEVPSFDGIVYGVPYPIQFTSHNLEYNRIIFDNSKYGASGDFLSYENIAEDGSGNATTAYASVPVVWLSGGWDNEEYRTITIKDELEDGWFKTWLKANATKQSTSVGGGFEMPQIRFTSAQSGFSKNEGGGCFMGCNYICDDDNPLYFTVEIVGGGALQVGDALQLCVRKGFMGSQANGFRSKYKLRKFAEYVVTENDLNKRYLTVATHPVGEGVPKDLYHDGKADCSDTLSPIYIRIRRPKGELQNNDSGHTVDATFSNIVTVWKLHYRKARQIKIL